VCLRGGKSPNVKSFLTVKALVSLFFAAIELLLPATLISMTGAAVTPDMVFPGAESGRRLGPRHVCQGDRTTVCDSEPRPRGRVSTKGRGEDW
jgi:hypothetical protein